MNLEQFLQMTSIITFVFATLVFFIKIGEIKTNATKDIEKLQEDVKNIEEHEGIQDKKIEDIKTKNDIAVNRIEGLLIEVKTKLEMLLQSGFSNDKTK